jgi:hypothetical protein
MSSLISPPTMSADTKIHLPRNSLRRRYYRDSRDRVPHYPRVILGLPRSLRPRETARNARDVRRVAHNPEVAGSNFAPADPGLSRQSELIGV